MRVKKFEAKNMKDALQMVKKELGPDAVILSARDNRRSFGIGGEASVEITAAVSETTLQKKHFVESRMTAQDRARFQTSDARTQRRIIEKVVEQRLQENADKAARRPITSQSYIEIQDDEIEQGGARRTAALDRAKGRNVRELLEDFSQDFEEADQRNQRRPARTPAPAPRRSELQWPAAEPSPPGGLPVSEKALSRIRNAAKEAWQAGIFTAQPTASAQAGAGAGGGMEMVAETSQQSSQEIASLKNEIGRLQKMLEGFQKVPQSFVTMHPGADYGIPYDLSFMFQKLTEAGVTIDHAVDILQQAAKELDPVQIKKRPIVDAWVARWFLDRTQVVSNPWQGRVHLFVGGSGSGKTSTLVKMASHLVVKEKKKVAVLSTDSFKVGAVDQMKIYCQILNVPFAVIRNRKDWEWVMGQLRHVDHVLVDFPGLQLRDLDEIHLLKSLLPPQELAAVGHLCVSATSKDGDAYEIARRYKAADYADLVITNLDQSVQHGIIANLQTKTGKPLHSFGIGSRIPEDFEAASKERVLDLIFKLTKLRRETK
jgi:flagellar biosynthesis protein FlhF